MFVRVTKSSPSLSRGGGAGRRPVTEGCRRASGGFAADPSTTLRVVPLPETSSGRIS